MSIFVCSGNHGKVGEYQEHFARNGKHFIGIREVESQANLSYESPVEDFDYFLGNAILKMVSALSFVYRARHKLAEPVESVIADDSGLCVPRLDFKPGVHSAYFGGFPQDALANRQALREGLQALAPLQQGEIRAPAFFICLLLEAKFDETVGLASAQSEANLKTSLQLEQIHIQEQIFFDRISQEMAQDGVGGFKRFDLNLEHFIPSLSIPFSIHFGFCFGAVSTVEQQLIPNVGHGYDSMFFSRRHPDLSFSSITMESKNEISHRAFAMKSFSLPS